MCSSERCAVIEMYLVFSRLGPNLVRDATVDIQRILHLKSLKQFTTFAHSFAIFFIQKVQQEEKFIGMFETNFFMKREKKCL